tara:strand:+ start:3774 stop:4328 length:555 start_codon:yes stop_codon:yes gene_type:complete
MKIDLFSVPIHITNIDVSKIKLISEEFKREWVSNTESSFGFKNKITDKSYEYLMITICNLLHPHLDGKTEIELQNIWENRYVKNDFQENHIHTGSHFSFIIYVSGDKSETVFFAPHKYLLECFYNNMFYANSYETELRPGQIVIFPSFLEHMVKKNSNTVTYAGNLKMILHEERQTLYKKRKAE